MYVNHIVCITDLAVLFDPFYRETVGVKWARHFHYTEGSLENPASKGSLVHETDFICFSIRLVVLSQYNIVYTSAS